MSRILLLGGASEIGLAIVAELLTTRGPAEVWLAGRSDSPHRSVAEQQAWAAGASRVEWLAFDACATDSHPALLAGVFDRHIDVTIVAFGLLGQPDSWRDHEQAVRIAQTNFTGALSVGVLLGQRLTAQAGDRAQFGGRRTSQANQPGLRRHQGRHGWVLSAAWGAAASAGYKSAGGASGGGTRPDDRRPAGSLFGHTAAGGSGKPAGIGPRVVRVPAIFTPIQWVFRNLPAALVDRLPW